MKYAVHYMRPDWFAQGIVGAGKPDPSNLAATHIHLKDVELPGDKRDLDRVFYEMQAEVWSPGGEARALIMSKGLRHTSMSVGDVIVCEGEVFVVAMFGFQQLIRGAA